MKNLENFKKLNRKELACIKGGQDNRQPEPVPFFLCPECYYIAAIMATRGVN
ncbi:ComC/BlpC family leader-containing pheromone/bacteriocin [Aquimarina brevivitae]|uniref:Bacteriocin-like protein n=1 Tax=Aquimarina brevivitae TaxID=323412 RepID=A0A4Q7PGC4_9FLAO|nr:ComC/BlpC family leader-containing pheromone/bacteriocin [Aquimarina brevivitae]RZS99546.1 bacteriocin-like protein [Aquimarina brevivitae]